MKLLKGFMAKLYGDRNVVMMKAEIDILRTNMVVRCRNCRQIYIVSRNPVHSILDHKKHICNE